MIQKSNFLKSNFSIYLIITKNKHQESYNLIIYFGAIRADYMLNFIIFSIENINTLNKKC